MKTTTDEEKLIELIEAHEVIKKKFTLWDRSHDKLLPCMQS